MVAKHEKNNVHINWNRKWKLPINIENVEKVIFTHNHIIAALLPQIHSKPPHSNYIRFKKNFNIL